MIRYNHALMRMERGHWYIGKFGRPLWKHAGFLSDYLTPKGTV